VWQQPKPKGPVGGFWAIDRREKALGILNQPGMAKDRLRRACNLWCALWAWPLEEAKHLPDQAKFQKELNDILGIDEEPPNLDSQLALLEEGKPSSPPQASDRPKDSKESLLSSVARQLCERLRPHHWELEFPEVFLNRGGFDLTVGNPPWIKLQWNEQGLLQELEPRLALDGVSASDTAKTRAAVLTRGGREAYVAECTLLDGIKAFLNGVQNYPLLVGVQTNLYKCFLERAWALGSDHLIVGMIHQEGLFQDPNGTALRREMNLRARHVYRFQNWLMLFSEVMKTRTFCLTVTSIPQDRINMSTCSNLFHPRTIDASYSHDGSGAVPDIKSNEGGFETRGHRNRIVRCKDEEFELFAHLFDRKGTSARAARLPLVHSQEVLSVLTKLARYPRQLTDIREAVLCTEMWHETNSQKDGTIRRETSVPKTPGALVISGPHFYVGNPLYKAARVISRTHRDYDAIDLTDISDDYLPRANYVPQCSPKEYLERTPKFGGRPVTEFYRHVNRRMIAVTGERTAAAAIIPPFVGHIGSVFSIAFEDEGALLAFSGLLASLPVDFYVRSAGISDLRWDLACSLPLPQDGSPWRSMLQARALRLNCLTSHYADLWTRNWAPIIGWSLDDPRLSSWPDAKAQWSRSVALHNHFERRWALIEIDALAALELGLTIEELCTIYRTQFSVLRQFERDTWYDQNGRIAFTSNVNLGIGLDRKDFDHWQQCLRDGIKLPKEFDTRGLIPPFEVRDRDADMTHAYVYFEAALR